MGRVGLIKSITSKKEKSAQGLYHVVESNAKHWQWAPASCSESKRNRKQHGENEPHSISKRKGQIVCDTHGLEPRPRTHNIMN